MQAVTNNTPSEDDGTKLEQECLPRFRDSTRESNPTQSTPLISHGEVVVFIAPPRGGKDYHTNALGEGLVFGAGDALAHSADDSSKIGCQIKHYMDEGLLVPEELSRPIIEAEFCRLVQAGPVVSNGFPRCQRDLELLDHLIATHNLTLKAVIYIEVPFEELLKRTTRDAGTRDREDDSNAKFTERYKNVFLKETLPIVEEYERRGLLKRINGSGSREQTQDKIRQALRN